MCEALNSNADKLANHVRLANVNVSYVKLVSKLTTTTKKRCVRLVKEGPTQ